MNESPNLEYYYLNDILGETDVRMFLYVENFSLIYVINLNLFKNKWK